MGDALELVEYMRPEDKEECMALVDGDLAMHLMASVHNCSRCFTVRDPEGKLILMFGVATYPTEQRTGVVWLLGTTLMEKYSYDFIRQSKFWLNELFGNHYDLLCNVVYHKNELHIRWLKWLGFKFIRKVAIGKKGEHFIEFFKVNHV